MKSALHHAIERFQLAFTSRCEAQIRRLIDETRREAFAEARDVLRRRTVKSMLDAAARAASSGEHRSGQQTPVQHAPALNDRILGEIEAIREQLSRNEALFSQIKPLIRSMPVSEE